MAYLIVGLVAFLAAGLTFFSGFGLGTLLLPALALFFPVEVAISATAVVHLINNLFKLTLVGRYAQRKVLLAFGVPAALAAVVGAWLLARLSGLPTLVEYSVGERVASITPVKIVIGVMILVFAWFDLFPKTDRPGFAAKWIPLGGVLSGMLGGLSGHQGALRSMFLIKAGLGKEGFIGTGTACSVLVDVSRLTVYGFSFLAAHLAAVEDRGGLPLVAAATLCAFTGSFVGSRLIKKVTLVTVQRTVGAALMLAALAMVAGWI